MNPRPPHTWIYCRASTDKQETSTDVQEFRCREYLVAHEDIPRELSVMVDQAISGGERVNQRPAGKEMLAAMSAGDHIIVAEFSRLSRDLLDLLKVIRWLHRRGAIVHVLDFMNQRYDPADPISELILSVVGAVVTWERKEIGRRTKRAMQHRIATGMTRLRLDKQPPYGWKFDGVDVPEKPGHQRLEMNPTEQAIIQQVYDLWKDGRGHNNIATRLNKNDIAARRPDGRATWRWYDVMRVLKRHRARLELLGDTEELAKPRKWRAMQERAKWSPVLKMHAERKAQQLTQELDEL